MSNPEEFAAYRICSGCDHANRATANFCENCGQRLPSKARCAQCGDEYAEGQRFCQNCGAPLTDEAAHPTAEPQADGGQVFAAPDRPPLPGLAAGAASALRAFRLWRSLGRPDSPSRAHPFELEEPPTGRGPSETAPPIPQTPVADFMPAGVDAHGRKSAAPTPLSYPVDAAGVRRSAANAFFGLLAILSAVGGQWLLRSGQSTPALGLYAFAIVLAVWAFRKQLIFDAPAAPSLGPIERLSPKWLLPILILPGAVAAWALNRLQSDPINPPNSFWPLHIASVLLFVACVYFVDRQTNVGALWPLRKRTPQPSPSHASNQERPRWKTSERLIGIVILCVGLFLRLYDLPELPFGSWYDETDYGLQAQRILQDPAYRPLFIGSLQGPAHYIYLVSALFLALPEVTFVIRLVSVLFGTLSVPAAFMAGNQLFGRSPGLILAFLVAVSRWSVNFSRIGMWNIPLTFFALLGIGFLLRALRRNRLTDYLWAGLFLGLGLNFYLAFSAFLLVVAVFLLHHIAAHFSQLRHLWKGLVVAAMGAFLFLAPLGVYVLEEPDSFFARSRNVSIFREYSDDQVWSVVRENAVTHLLMYNVRGDPNGRHNLPGEPMLAPIAGALLVLGLGICLSRFWRPRPLLLVIWFVGMISGGILTLSFEAPQSLRAIGTLPASYLLGTVPLALLWQNWRAAASGMTALRNRAKGAQGGGGSEIDLPSFLTSLRSPLNSAVQWILPFFLWRGLPVLFMSILLLAVAVHNYTTYFERQRNDFAVWNAYSTGESIAATIIAQNVRRNDTDVFLTSHYAGHPTVRFIAAAESLYQRVNYTATLPMPLSSDRDALFLMDPQRRNFYEQARDFYPNAQFVEHRPPFGGPTVLYEARLKPFDITSIQGMRLAYFEGDAWSGNPVTVEKKPTVNVEWPQDAPLDAPFSAEWKGVLNVERYGPYRLVLRAPAAAELYVDEELVAHIEEGAESSAGGQVRESVATLELALGLHNLRVRAVGGEGAVSLSWQPPDEEEEFVPTAMLHTDPVTSSGLLGRYYPNGDWQEPAAFARIDPLISIYFHDIPLPRPYTVEWTGKLAVPEEGDYRLGIESIDESELWIDGQSIAASLEPNQYVENSVALTAGLHDIRIRYVARTSHYHVNLHWTPPGQGNELIPSEALIPPQGNYANVTIEDLAIFDETPQTRPDAPSPQTRPAASPPQTETLPAAQEETTAAFDIVSASFERPRGVTAANGRLYVVDPSQGALVVLDNDGRQSANIRRSNRLFNEPVDVAADADGNIYLLDAGDGGHLSVHTPEGEFLRTVPIADDVASQSRGLDVDDQGRIWLALTPVLVVAAFDADGQELIRFSTDLDVFGEVAPQPIDVAYHADDAVYVSAVGTPSVIRFSRAGEPLAVWPLAPANSVDGPHLALDSEGVLYVTQPERGGFLRISGDEQVEVWSLPASQPPRKLVGVTLGQDEDLLVTDSENGNLYRVPIPP